MQKKNIGEAWLIYAISLHTRASISRPNPDRAALALPRLPPENIISSRFCRDNVPVDALDVTKSKAR